jgi:hypothetical protein
LAGNRLNESTMLGRMGLTFDRTSIARSIAGEWGLPVFDRLHAFGSPGMNGKREDPLVKELLSGADFDRRTGAADTLALRMAGIRDHQVIREICARTTSEHSVHEALERLRDDRESIIYVFNNATSGSARNEAIARLCKDAGKLEEPDLIKRMIVQSTYMSHKNVLADRLALMMERLDDTHCLRVIFAYGTREDDKREVVRKLAAMVDSIDADFMALKMVAVYSHDEAARTRALGKLAGKPQSIVVVANISNFEDTRLEAVGMLSGVPECLVQVAVNASFEDSMFAAVGALGDDLQSLKEVAKRSRSLDVRSAAIKEVTELMSRVHDATSLRFIIMDADDENTQAAAADKLAGMVDGLTNRYDLIYVAMLSTKRKARVRAVDMLAADHDALNVVASHSKHDDSRKKASELLHELETRP